MKADYLKDKRQLISRLLLLVSVILGVLILFKVTGFFTVSARAERLVANAVAQSKADPNDAEKHFVKERKTADELKKKNLFVPPSPKQEPIKKVSAILGDEVLVDGKWYKVGDRIGDANVVAIEATCARFEWNGKEIVKYPMDLKPSPAKKKPIAKAPPKKAEERPQPVVEVGPRPRGPGDRMSRGRGMRRMFENMSEEEREAFRARMRERAGQPGR